ncbi:MAG: FAD-dependent oxidoreductase [Fischerella sp. CENA71]|nr:FAD-dependent oxidoreductase [Fischerella sp. CENA71]
MKHPISYLYNTVFIPKRSIQICIIGGGFAGLFTALYLSKYTHLIKSLRPRIILIDQKEHFLFTPLLYELLTQEVDSWEITPTFAKLLANTAVEFCHDTVEAVNLEQRQIELRSHKQITYDHLVLAVGQQTRLDAIPGITNYAYAFRSLADAERLMQKLQSLETDSKKHIQIAIIGAGGNGVELACKLANRLQNRGQVYLIDRRQKILRDFSFACQKAAHRALITCGVKLDLGTQIENFAASQITLSKNQQTYTLPVDLIVWTIGTQNWEWLNNLNCRQNPQGKLLVRSTLQLFDYPEVFAVGDIAAIHHPDKQKVPATAQAALQQARTAASNLRASLTGKPLKIFRYHHLGEMMTLGINAGVVFCCGICLEGSIAYTIRRWACVLRLPTFNHRLRVCRHLLSAAFRRVFPINQQPM